MNALGSFVLVQESKVKKILEQKIGKRYNAKILVNKVSIMRPHTKVLD